MGRKKVYQTEEARKQAKLASNMRYYWRNVIEVREQNRQRYHNKLNEKVLIDDIQQHFEQQS